MLVLQLNHENKMALPIKKKKKRHRNFTQVPQRKSGFFIPNICVVQRKAMKMLGVGVAAAC